MTTFETAMREWTALDEAVLARPWSWREKKMDVRYALYRTLEDAQGSVLRATAAPQPESRRILALAQRAFGDLRGLLTGLPIDLLDKAPRPSEWPIRDTLRHVLVTERRYAIQTRYAIERADAEPVRIADARLPTPDQMDVSGDVDAILVRVAEARAETNRRLGDIPLAAMTRPTIWVHYDIDVRFRLHRFAAHVVEHTIQCEKTLDALGWRQTEGRRIVRRIWSHVGELEGLGAVEEVSALNALVAERLAATRLTAS